MGARKFNRGPFLLNTCLPYILASPVATKSPPVGPGLMVQVQVMVRSDSKIKG